MHDVQVPEGDWLCPDCTPVVEKSEENSSDSGECSEEEQVIISFCARACVTACTCCYYVNSFLIRAHISHFVHVSVTIHTARVAIQSGLCET